MGQDKAFGDDKNEAQHLVGEESSQLGKPTSSKKSFKRPKIVFPKEIILYIQYKNEYE
jgi:hypothetical protein